jgi:hypothetical protein
MMSHNWFKALRRIVLTLALALTLASTFTPPKPPDHPTPLPELSHPAIPQVNWGS